jgi:glycosyltransferase involved in cell wall biosynthesis
MSRILIVLPDPPLPFGNAAARWYYVLARGLAERGHQVTTFAACPDPAQAEEARALFAAPEHDLRLFRMEPGGRGPWARLRSLRRPYSYVFGPELRHELRAELARGFDVLHLEQLWSGYLGREHAEQALLHIHFLFHIDMAERPIQSAADRVLRVATRRAESRLLRAYPNISTLSPRLTEEVRRISPRSEVRTVPLGMDLSLYPFESPGPRDGGPVVGLIGSFQWQPTRSAAERLVTRLWPEIRSRVPGARLRLVGRKARAAMAHLVLGPDVELFEDVPDAVPYFRGLDVLLYAPGPASGMKVKVLEAFALGVPVVTNADGVEGLPALDGDQLGIAEDDAGLVERTVALLADPALRDRRRLAARALVEAHCRPEPVLDRLEEVYCSIRRPDAAPAPLRSR